MVFERQLPLDVFSMSLAMLLWVYSNAVYI
jgi:hypothetical protein